MCLSQPRAITDNIGGRQQKNQLMMFGNLGKLSFTILPAVSEMSGFWWWWSVARDTSGTQTPDPGLWLVNSCPILASDWLAQWPGDHPWPRAAQSPGTHLACEHMRPSRHRVTHHSQNMLHQVLSMVTESLARIINHIIQRNLCALDVSTGACQNVSLIHMYDPYCTVGNLPAKLM